MSDIVLIEDTTRRLITDALTPAVIEAAEHGSWPGESWARLEGQGLLQPSAIAEGSDDAEAGGVPIANASVNRRPCVAGSKFPARRVLVRS